MEQPPAPNGRWVTRYEWDAHAEWSRGEVRDIQAAMSAHDARLSALERRWERYAGPFVMALAILGVIATVASVLSAAYHLLA